jgi:uncharacterized protein
MNRRDFLVNAGKGIVGAGLAAGICSDPALLFGLNKRLEGIVSSPMAGKSELKFRKFGKTGLEVTEVSVGAMITKDPSVIEHALDLGINYIDTAARYQGGNNEKMIGALLGKKRSTVIIATKVHLEKLDTMRETVEKSLKSLQTDYVDVLFLHGLSSEEEVNDGEGRELLAALKKQGKIRFAGISTHKNMPEVIRAAAKSGFHDVVLTTYNFKVDQDVKDAIAEARKAGLAIVAMKVMAGGYQAGESAKLNPFQAALKWVLEDKNIDTAIPSVTTIEQVDQNFSVMGSPLTFYDRKALGRYGDEIASHYCRMCGACGQTCKRGVRCTDILRFLMYAEGYGEFELAREEYSSLKAEEQAAQCLSCGTCMMRCASRLNMKNRMREAHRLFA